VGSGWWHPCPSVDLPRPPLRLWGCITRRRPNVPRVSTCEHSGPGPWTPQLGGERAYRGRLGKGRCPAQSGRSHSAALRPLDAKRQLAVRESLLGSNFCQQPLCLGDLGHFRRRRKAFERRGEDGVGFGGSGGRLVELGERKRGAQSATPPNADLRLLKRPSSRRPRRGHSSARCINPIDRAALFKRLCKPGMTDDEVDEILGIVDAYLGGCLCAADWRSWLRRRTKNA
jgi:hypothetical protein